MNPTRMATPPIIGLTLNYRDPMRTTHCVRSLLDDGVHSVLVWDNSDDGGCSAQALRLQWQGNSAVHITESPCNLGFAAGVNQGLRTIIQNWPGAWIMLLNNDATLRPGALQALAAALVAQPQAVLAYPRVNHSGHEIGTVYYQRHFALLRFDRPWPGSFPSPGGSALLIAPERDLETLFDEDFFMYGEDVYLGWRLGVARMACVPLVLVDHEGSASSGMASAFYESRLVAGHWLLAHKLARHLTDRLLLKTGRVITLSARAVVRALRYRNLRPIQALWDGWRLARGCDPAWLAARAALAQLKAAPPDSVAPPATSSPPAPR